MRLLRRVGVWTAIGLLWCGASAAAQTHTVIPLATKDLVYSPLTQRLYASVPSLNSIVEINPDTGTSGASLFVGSQPNKLAISEDGAYLYVGIDGAAAVVRVYLPTLTLDLQFFLGSDYSGPFRAMDMAVQPGNPHVLAVVRQTDGYTRHVAIYDQGVMRPETTSTGPPFSYVTRLAFSSSLPSRLYGFNSQDTGFEFYRLQVNGLGVMTMDGTPGLVEGFGADIAFDAGRVYASGGEIVEPEARVLAGTCTLTPPSYLETLAAPDAQYGVVYYLTREIGSTTPYVLRPFSVHTFLPIGSAYVLTGTLGDFHDDASGFVRWGTDGLAFRTPMSQVVLIRTGGVARTPPGIAITSPGSDPTLTAAGSSITLSGSTSGPVSSVMWSSNRGFSGTAAGASPWFASDIPLVTGANVITLTAIGPTGLRATDTVTVNVAPLSYYLAEGATGAFFDLDLALANPHSNSVPADITFLKEGGTTVSQSVTLPATSRTTIRVDDIPGLEAGSVSAVVTSPTGAPIVVERTMRWEDGRQYGAHTEKATPGPAEKWYFAEGSQGFFATYLLLANPNPTANVATVEWLRESAPAIQRTYSLLPNSRTTIDAGADAALVSQSFGIVVTFSQPGVAERAMYFGVPPGPALRGGHSSAGVTAPSESWFFAEGATGPFFDTFILLANPNGTAVNVEVKFLPNEGAPVTRTVPVPAHARRTINIESLTPAAPSLSNAAVATQVTAPLPIVAERAQYWSSPWYEAHNSAGVTATARRWGLAEGRVGQPAGLPSGMDYQTYILLANPGTSAATVTLTFLRTTGTTVQKTVTVSPLSRLNVAAGGPGSDVPELSNEMFGTVIDSDQPIVVERAVYGSTPTQAFASGTNATATRLP